MELICVCIWLVGFIFHNSRKLFFLDIGLLLHNWNELIHHYLRPPPSPILQEPEVEDPSIVLIKVLVLGNHMNLTNPKPGRQEQPATILNVPFLT